jgi:hypothetical protein
MALAVTLAAGFWPLGPGPSGAVSVYWLVVLSACVLLVLGVAPRSVGLILVVLLLALQPHPGRRVSRQILIFVLLAFSFVASGNRLSLFRSNAAVSTAGPMWPIRLIQAQLSLLYGIKALAKTTPEYLRGDVLVTLSTLPNFHVDLTGGELRLGFLILPVAWAAIATVVMEYALAIGFWFRPLRWATAALGLAFHVVLTRIVSIGMLDTASVFLYLSFLLPLERQESELWSSKGSHPDSAGTLVAPAKL